MIYKVSGILIGLVAFNQIFILSPFFPQSIYYIIMFAGLGVGVLTSNKSSVNGLMMWLILAGIISLIVNSVPSYFRAPLRLVTFTALVGLIGPVFLSAGLNQLKNRIFSFVNFLIFVFATLSFLVYLGLPVPQYKGFSGFFTHSMMLGPMAGIGLVIGFYQFFNNLNQEVAKRKKWLVYTGIIFCFFSLLLASSRSAIAGASTGLVFFFYKYYQHRISKLIGVLFTISMALAVTFPLWSDYTEGIQEKQASAMRQDDLASSRRSYWDARWEEFKSSPVFGIGFATLDATKSGSNVRENTGGIEPGTSWLTILSMVGVFGFIPVLLLFFLNFRYLLRDRIDPLKSATLGGLLIFFVTHMFAEGYIFASGGFLFFYVWLLLGIIEVYKYNPSVRIL